jgi:hypothetical protein
MTTEVNFKRYKIRYTIHGPWDDEVEPIVVIYCRLYEPTIEGCKYSAKKCKNCSVYHGFKGSGRL